MDIHPEDDLDQVHSEPHFEVPKNVTVKNQLTAEDQQRYENIGLEAIRNGTVAVVLLAGG